MAAFMEDGAGPVVTVFVAVTPVAETVWLFPLHPELDNVICPVVFTMLFVPLSSILPIDPLQDKLFPATKL